MRSYSVVMVPMHVKEFGAKNVSNQSLLWSTMVWLHLIVLLPMDLGRLRMLVDYRKGG